MRLDLGMPFYNQKVSYATWHACNPNTVTQACADAGGGHPGARSFTYPPHPAPTPPPVAITALCEQPKGYSDSGGQGLHFFVLSSNDPLRYAAACPVDWPRLVFTESILRAEKEVQPSVISARLPPPGDTSISKHTC
ncbi:hypothetical protein OBRU01_07091 [Operophtera brumata]|uniref:Uncharacterized protein n=1 Tax=Operophtera brumata TaxID=104452 RepID=A0A0L7LBN6_OPEBR|nr:hypothetical protein OBRU01_07091 [Operophtera brumata]